MYSTPILVLSFDSIEAIEFEVNNFSVDQVLSRGSSTRFSVAGRTAPSGDVNESMRQSGGRTVLGDYAPILVLRTSS